MPGNDRLIYLIFTAQQHLRTYLKNTLAGEGVRITPAQAGILFLLDQEQGQNMTALSRVLAIDNSTMTGLVNRLEKRGFVRRVSGPSDRRISRIFITPEGAAEVDRAKAVINRVNQEITAGFSQEEARVFKRVLQSFFGKFRNMKPGGLYGHRTH